MPRSLSVLLALALLSACAGDDPVDDTAPGTTDTDPGSDTDTDTGDPDAVSASLDLAPRAAGTVGGAVVVGTVSAEGVAPDALDLTVAPSSVTGVVEADGTLVLTADETLTAEAVDVTLAHDGEELAAGTVLLQIGPDRSVWADWKLGGRVVEAVDTTDDGDIHWFVHSEVGVMVQKRAGDGSPLDDRSVSRGIAQPARLAVLDGGGTVLAARVQAATTGRVDTAAFVWPDQGIALSEVARVSTDGTDAHEIRVRDLALHTDGELSVAYEAFGRFDGRLEPIGHGVDRFAWEGERLVRQFRKPCQRACRIAGAGDALRIAGLTGGTLQSLDADGAMVWSTTGGGEAVATTDGGRTLTCGANVVAYDADGVEQWSTSLVDDGGACTHLEVGFDGSAFVITDQGRRLVRVGPGGEIHWSTPVPDLTDDDVRRVTGYSPEDFHGDPRTFEHLTDVQIRDVAIQGGDLIAVGTLWYRFEGWDGPRDGKLVGVVVRVDAATGAFVVADGS